MTNAHWIYTQTIKTFAAGAEPPFEDPSELLSSWGQVWGIDNDVGRIRSILMHRPGPELNVVDPAHRLPEIGSYGDPAVGWYFQSDTLPDLPLMQRQHDAFVAALQAEGVEVHCMEGEAGNRLKQIYT
ncbi:MAG: amidinotransferase, partial [Rhodobacterales bacterium 17-64-5]